ncbi:bone morphogenetic protein 15-like [Polyodon spathula]|uniref:bone morphogenetic protein 15-like n=1 Tax=Polyodon spathula TaxID=7913 RepID=UPI001B7E9EAB|nr:bone morphogenetic protein 15-like [Polyodon spathula]
MKATHRCNVFNILTFMVLLKSAALTREENPGERPSSLLNLVLTERMNQPQKTMIKRQANDPNLQYMMGLYSRAADLDGRPRENRTVGANTVRLVKSSTTDTRYRAGTDPWCMHTVEYKLKILPTEKLVKAAIVHSRPQSPLHGKVTCQLKLLSEDPPVEDEPTTAQKDRWVFSFKPEDKWVETDITSHIAAPGDCLRGRLSLCIQYFCTDARRTRRTSRVEKKLRTACLQVPALLLYLNDSQKTNGPSLASNQNEVLHQEKDHQLSRRTRQLSNIGSDIPNYMHKNNIRRNECKLHMFRVSFHQLGWEHWIIAPHNYNPKYCKGDCPRILQYGYNSPNHAIVQNFINELVDSGVPRPSCVPYKYKPISVLMMEQNGSIVYKEYEDMIAESCTCR